MINSTEVFAAELLLSNADFPDDYVNMQHPDDYNSVSKPFVQYIPHYAGHHNRLIARICWEIGDKKYIPMSFVCDTGAPMGFYLSDKAQHILRSCGRITEDETGNEYVQLKDLGIASVQSTPPGHAPANIIGLRLLIKLVFQLKKDGSFVFGDIPDAF